MKTTRKFTCGKHGKIHESTKTDSGETLDPESNLLSIRVSNRDDVHLCLICIAEHLQNQCHGVDVEEHHYD